MSDDEISIVITVTEEPLYLNPFLEKVIKKKSSKIDKIYKVGGSLVRGRNWIERFSYLVTILLISGIWHSIKRASILISYRIREAFSFLNNARSIEFVGDRFDIPVEKVEDINSNEFLSKLEEDQPTIVINQAQAILDEDFLSIPDIGCLNRHNALLPKYRGLMAPFWTYLNEEDYSGVSIHFIDEKIDNGPILVQKKIKIERFDTFNSVLEKNFKLAPEAMLEAIDLIEDGGWNENLEPNPEEKATYYSHPTISDALKYRKVMISRWLYGK